MAQITDLNHDCLEHIFKRFDLNDLMNVADSNKHLREGARLTYLSKYSIKRVYLSSWGLQRSKISAWRSSICVDGFIISLKFIRCFGQGISKLDLTYPDSPQSQRDALDFYLNEFCGANLVHLKLREANLKNRMNPFPKLQTVELNGFSMEYEQSDLIRCFPNMRSLVIWLDLDLIKSECIAVHFAHLERLTIKMGATRLEKETLATCLRLNPQLRRFCIYGRFDFEVLQTLSEYPQLEVLDMYTVLYDKTKQPKIDAIHFKNIHKLAISCKTLDYLMKPKILISFDRLKELKIDANHCSLKQRVVKFVRRNPSIKKFTVDCINPRSECCVCINTEIKLPLARALATATEVHFTYHTFTVDEIMDFVNKCKSIRIFTFRLSHYNKYDLLRRRLNRLNTEWRTSVSSCMHCNDHIKLER